MSISILRNSADRGQNRRRFLDGLDGGGGGWVVATGPSASGEVTVDIAPEFRCILERVAVDSIVAIDIPIGIPANELRTCDSGARRVLGWPRSSSVFSPPSRKA